MGNDRIEPIPWLGEGSVPPGSGVLPEPVRPRGRIGLVAGSLALVLGMGVGGVAVSQLSQGEQPGSGVTTTQTEVDDAGAAQGTGTAAQPQPVTGEERDED